MHYCQIALMLRDMQEEGLDGAPRATVDSTKIDFDHFIEDQDAAHCLSTFLVRSHADQGAGLAFVPIYMFVTGRSSKVKVHWSVGGIVLPFNSPKHG